MQCSICVDPLRNPCECVYCKYTACRKCVQHYLLTTHDDPHCMNCKKKWNREKVDALVSAHFRNSALKKHRETILFEREKALLPAAQEEIVKQEKRKQIMRQRRELYRSISLLYRENYPADQRERMMKELEDQVDALDAEEAALFYGRKQQKEKPVFTIHCPGDNCRGFITEKDWECGMCHTKICKDCFEIEATEHMCKTENIETAKLLRSDTKPCPNCATFIYKISGCNQMWCTQCHIAFDWTTGQRETGVIHNPHYYEWNGRQNELHYNIEEDEFPSYYRLREQMDKHFTQEQQELIRKVFNIHMTVTHTRHVELLTYRVTTPVPESANMDLRIQYLQNRLTETVFKQKLQQREKQHSKSKELYDIYEMYVATMTDYFVHLYNNIPNYKTVTELEQWLSQVKQLQLYVNEQLKTVSKRYSNKVYYYLPVIE